MSFVMVNNIDNIADLNLSRGARVQSLYHRENMALKKQNVARSQLDMSNALCQMPSLHPGIETKKTTYCV